MLRKKSPSSHRTQNTPPPSPASYFPALEEEHQAVATTTQEHPSTNIAPQSLQSWGTLPPRAPPQEGPTKEPLTMPNPPSHQKKNISLEIVQNPASSTQKKTNLTATPHTCCLHSTLADHHLPPTKQTQTNTNKPPLQEASTTQLEPFSTPGTPIAKRIPLQKAKTTNSSKQ